MRILSIQSAVAFGHVGNSAAVFPLQRLGHEVMPVFTVQFSNHTGYGAWRGPVLAGTDVAAVIAGIEDRGVLADVDLVLSGYQGSPEIAGVILEAVQKVKRANPSARYACDPVMGNATSGCFVDPAIPPLIRDQVVPVADLITPNQFELGELTGRPGLAGDDAPSLEQVLSAADAARSLGPETVLVTSVSTDTAAADTIGLLVVDGTGAWQLRTPRLPMKANGSGDVTAALFAAQLLTSDPATALARTASSVFDLLENTLRAESRELLLVESQETYAHPRLQFEVERIR
ncbi:pyridoxal kinase PdxY [Nocardioides marmoriginsengisoli]|uniref:pyridoxal kinase n=1 Tax=Nocardioides marmoriginsengisoli TaxID=661483 RepID=A0A3N0CRQ0_9ACTN|nr:pyridoxal kinase PdxY [Nocardioides marmoriginsengisoli]RNL66128.1 pyridoxal kinase PdxY [Nocardioides marmoriginsengisoli]